MRIKIDDKWMLASDKRQWMIKHFKGYCSETGKEIWNSVSYHSSPQQAVQSLANRLIRLDDAEHSLRQ